VPTPAVLFSLRPLRLCGLLFIGLRPLGRARTEESKYRLRLAEGFLEEARQDIASQRWRSCVDNSQLAVENAAKAVLALLGPVGRTHNPAVLLRQALDDGRFPKSVCQMVERLAECAELLGPDFHAQSDSQISSKVAADTDERGGTDNNRSGPRASASIRVP